MLLNKKMKITPQQRDIYFAHIIKPESAQYNIGSYTAVKGDLDITVFQKAVKSLGDYFDVCRIESFSRHEERMELASDALEINFPFYDYTRGSDPETLALEWMQNRMDSPFNIYESAPFEFALIKVAADEYWFFMRLHHLFADGQGIVTLINFIFAQYDHLLGNTEFEPDYPGYFDITEPYRAYEGSEEFQTDKEYWEDKFKEVVTPPIKELKTALEAAGHYDLPISEVRQQKIQDYCKANSINLQHLLVAILCRYFHQTEGSRCLDFHLTLHNRNSKRERNVLGTFAKVIPSRVPFDPVESIGTLLGELKSSLRKDYRHKKYPISEIEKFLRNDPNNDSNPLLISVNHKYFDLQPKASGIKGIVTELESQFLKIPLDFVWSDLGNDQGFFLRINFNKAYFNAEEVKYMAERIDHMIDQLLVVDPETPLEEISVLPEEEKSVLLYDFNGTNRFQKDTETFLDVFTDNVREYPNSIAVSYQGQELTYLQVDERSNQLAHYLKGQYALSHDDLVVLLMDRSPLFMITVLGIWKAGGAYLPIDPDYPDQRVKDIIEASRPKALFIDQAYHSRVSELVIDQEIGLEPDPAVYTDRPTIPLKRSYASEALSYVIYTSGSTGRPKGAMIEHRGMLNHLYSKIEEMDLDHDCVVAQNASQGFDISVWQFFVALMVGGKTIVYSKADVLQPNAFAKNIVNDQVNVLEVVPTYLSLLLEQEENGQLKSGTFQGLKHMMVTGETLPATLANKWLALYPGIPLINAYGPTEASDDITHYQVLAPQDGTVPLGRPIRNMQIYILDKANEISGIGVKGELCVSGIGVGRGYLYDSERTAGVFVPDPFRAGEKMYRTGDVARFRWDGEIEYFGRIDHQIKLNGHRIELGEIEHAILRSFSSITNVAVCVVPTSGRQLLVAYYAAAASQEKVDLKTVLQKQLPDYMVPEVYVHLEELPVTVNGKIDRAALPSIELKDQVDTYIAPSTADELTMAEVWCDILKLDRIGVSDNFFELGGDSLLAMRLSGAISSAFNQMITVDLIFKKPSIRELLEEFNGPIVTEEAHKGKSSGGVLPLPDKVPLSFAQQRLWLIDGLFGSVNYHLPALLKLEGHIHVDKLSQVLKSLVNRHLTIRTVIEEHNGVGYQRLLDARDFELGQMQDDLSTEGFEVWVEEETKRPFDLQKDFMLRATYCKNSTGQYLLIVAHHIAFDGLSLPIFISDLQELYAQSTAENSMASSHLSYSYQHYSVWQNERFTPDYLEPKLKFWEDYLKGVSPLSLNPDFPRPVQQSFEGADYYLRIQKSTTDRLKVFAQEQETTLFMLLLSIYKVFLYRHSQEEDICVGVPVANRDSNDLQNLIGFFVNTVAVRTQLNPELSYVELLKEVKQNVLDAYRYQDVPFGHVVDRVVRSRNQSFTPIFQTMFAFQQIEDTTFHLGEASCKIQPIPSKTAKFDLEFDVSEIDGALNVRIEYSTALFHPETIELMAGHFEAILEDFVAQPAQSIAATPLVRPQEAVKLEQFNQTERKQDPQETFLDVFAKNVRAYPNEIAVFYQGEYLTYRQVDKKSNQLAHYLKSQFALSQDDLVALLMDRSDRFMITVLGIWKAGGAYLPIDPEYPDDRIYTILDSARPKVAFVDASYYDRVADFLHTTGVGLIDGNQEFNYLPSTPVRRSYAADSLSYVIYTSGSTGKPKGAMIEHRGMLNHLYSKAEEMNLDHTSVVAQNASQGFDISVWQFFVALLVGGHTVVYSKWEVLAPNTFAASVANDEVNVLEVVPTYLSLLLEQEEKGHIRSGIFSGLKYLMVTGETLPPTVANKWLAHYPHIPLVNAYGPTEASDDITHYQMTEPQQGSVPLGRPIRNMRIYILDEFDQWAGIGVKGELCVSGIGVGRGYLFDMERTTQVFMPDPFREGEVMYRTGDIARYRWNGEIEYFGRVDNQVKLNGHRIELGEIEHEILRSIQEINNVAVMVAQAETRQYLVAYYAASEAMEKVALKATLQKRLPEYMVPDVYVHLHELPVTVNGKIDRPALPAPNTDAQEDIYVAPRTSEEVEMAEVWRDLLQQEQIGVSHNFFELGGNSVMAMRLVAMVRETFGVELKVNQVFEFDTVETLSAYVELLRSENEGDTSEEYEVAYL